MWNKSTRHDIQDMFAELVDQAYEAQLVGVAWISSQRKARRKADSVFQPPKVVTEAERLARSLKASRSPLSEAEKVERRKAAKRKWWAKRSPEAAKRARQRDVKRKREAKLHVA